VAEGGGALGLPLEAFDELLVVGVAPAHDLEGDGSVEDVVVGQVDLGHAPGPEGSDDPVTVVYELFQTTAL
jgi:hypothetical protein